MLFPLFFYFSFLFALVLWSSRKVKSSSDFIIGDRSLNFWLTALAAHASDMSSWLFMGYPALIFTGGLFKSWVAIGLVFCMWLNWQLVAKKLRTLTGEWNCSTFSSFLNIRYQDKSGLLQLFSAIFCFVFYIVYLCAGLISLGLLGESLLGLSYSISISIGACIVFFYVVVGGFITLAWIDFVQGIFLLAVLCITPFFIIHQKNEWHSIIPYLTETNSTLKLLPTSLTDVFSIITMAFGWGLGYFGQPHIITKFMGIKNTEEISKSRNVGMVWMISSLMAATLVGLVGISFFKSGIEDPQMIFVEMAKQTFSPFLTGLILCAVLAATINVMSSQLLILSSIITEDVYKVLSKEELSSKQLMRASRFWMLITTVAAYFIADMKISSIYNVVHYAWSGLGASFGPLIIVSLYFQQPNKHGALAGIVIGGFTAGLWPFIDPIMPFSVSPIIPGFFFSTVSIFFVSYLTKNLGVFSKKNNTISFSQNRSS